MSNTQNQTEKRVAVVITAANHKHEGQSVSKGTSIDTDPATAKWLVDNKAGVFAGGDVASAKKETK